MSLIAAIPFYALTDISGRKVDVNLAQVIRVCRSGENLLICFADRVVTAITGQEVQRFLTALELAKRGISQ